MIFAKGDKDSIKDEVTEKIADKVSDATKESIKNKIDKIWNEHKGDIYLVGFGIGTFTLGFFLGNNKGYSRCAVDCWKAMVKVVGK